MAAINADSSGKRIMALSSDAWPLNCDDGTELHVIDTGEEYIFCDGMWEQDLRRSMPTAEVL